MWTDFFENLSEDSTVASVKSAYPECVDSWCISAPDLETNATGIY